MAERLHPGVYIEEVPSGVRPIEGVGTSTAAFVGVAARGRPGAAHFVTSYDAYVQALGGALPGEDGHLALAVDAFFKAGGRRAYVVRVLPAGAEVGRATAVPARFTPAGAARPNALLFRARAAGAWSSVLRVNVAESRRFPGQAFNVEVLSVETGVPRRLELFEDLSMDPRAETYVAEVINNNGSRLIEVVDLAADDASGAEPAEHVPTPEQAPSLRIAAPTEGGTAPDLTYTHRIRRNARMTFQVRIPGEVLAPGERSPTSRDVVFSDDALLVLGANRTFDDDDTATLTRAELVTLLRAQLGITDAATDDYRIVAPTAPDEPLEIQARVATQAMLVLSPRANENLFTLTGKTVALSVVVGTNAAVLRPIYAPPDPANPEVRQVTAAQLLALVEAGIAADDTLSAEQRGESVVIRAARNADRVVLALSITNGDAATNPRTFAQDGQAGRIVSSLDSTELLVSEQRDALRPSTMRELGIAARARGYQESSAANPLALPATQDNLRIAGGTDGPAGATLTVTDYVGARADHTGLHALDEVDVNMVAIPGRNTSEFLAALMTYVDGREDCFAILDGPGSADPRFEADALEARQFVDGLPNRSKNAAIYYPWVEIADPTGVGKNPVRMVPPSGHVAGIYARTDTTRGVWKAPAGLEAVVNEALDVQSRVIDADQDILNPFSMNCIRQFPGAGIVVWGARTLSSDPEWRYVNVRRTALFIEESLRLGLRWAVFASNDQPLWDQIRTNIKAFMMGLFRQGAFQGATPDEAFRVTCDRSTNPQERVDAGIVTARVEFAPLKPAEFVVIEISQKNLVVS